MRPGAMLGDVDALPDLECERPGNHGDVERHAREHGLYMRRHIVRPLDIMNPVSTGGREAIERAHKVGAYVGIGVFLDDERGRRMPHEHEQRASFAPVCLMNRIASRVISVKACPLVSTTSVAVAMVSGAKLVIGDNTSFMAASPSRRSSGLFQHVLL